MSVISMTGFARAEGGEGVRRWAWELRTVNGKSSDIRLRLPPGFESLETEARARIGKAFERGNCQCGLSVSGFDSEPELTLNEPVLAGLLDAANRLAERRGLPPVGLDALLGLRGVVEAREPELDEAARAERDAALLATLSEALADLREARQSEGKALEGIVLGQIQAIETLTRQAEAAPQRRPEAIRARLEGQIAQLMEAGSSLEPDRLHQEAMMLAAKADIREELDRLHAHVAQARALLALGKPVGRKLDFLAQEFNREANTLCSKANDVAITTIGLELKTVIDQFREQIQNIE